MEIQAALVVVTFVVKRLRITSFRKIIFSFFRLFHRFFYSSIDFLSWKSTIQHQPQSHPILILSPILPIILMDMPKILGIISLRFILLLFVLVCLITQRNLDIQKEFLEEYLGHRARRHHSSG